MNAPQNGNPAIGRMMEILEAIESAPEGLSLKEIVARTKVTKSTAYRILNSLEAARLVQQIDHGDYRLGGRFLQFAQHVVSDKGIASALPRLQPLLQEMAKRTGETHKISVLDQGVITVVAGASGHTPFALSYVVGESLPLHAGAASKVLLAHISRAERDAVLPTQLKVLTERTFVEREDLEIELRRIRHEGWAFDGGEYSPNVHACAAPIRDAEGRTVAALSIAFLPSKNDEQATRMRDHALASAGHLSNALEDALESR